MRRSLEFVFGILDQDDPARVSWGDFQGPHGLALRLWQRHGFLSADPEPLHVPSCPYCHEGVSVAVVDRLLCGECLSDIDREHLGLWRFDVIALLVWLARSLGVGGDVRPMDGHLWQLGCRMDDAGVSECFFLRGVASDRERARLLAYRDAVLLVPLPSSAAVDGFGGRVVPVLDLVRMDRETMTITGVTHDRDRNGTVRFDAESGSLSAGKKLLGEVPVGTKEYHLLACLAKHLDRFVAYADLKHEVLRRSGSRDTTDEATFCQKLKSRIKRRVPNIDRLIATTNKGDGYRLRGRVEP